MRPGKSGNAVPHDPIQVDVLDAVAVDVKLILVGEPRHAFRDAAFGAVPLIDEG